MTESARRQVTTIGAGSSLLSVLIYAKFPTGRNLKNCGSSEIQVAIIRTPELVAQRGPEEDSEDECRKRSTRGLLFSGPACIQNRRRGCKQSLYGSPVTRESDMSAQRSWFEIKL